MYVVKPTFEHHLVPLFNGKKQFNKVKLKGNINFQKLCSKRFLNYPQKNPIIELGYSIVRVFKLTEKAHPNTDA